MKTTKGTKSCCPGIEIIEDPEPVGGAPNTSRASNSEGGRAGLWLSLGAAGMAVLSGIGCCGLPVLSSLLATLGVGSGFLTALQPFQPYLIGVAVLALGYEFYKAYRPLPETACCSRTGKRVALWGTTVLMASLLLFQGRDGEGPEDAEVPPSAVNVDHSTAGSSCCPDTPR